MKKTYLNKLTSEELKTLFKNNEHLQELANELYRNDVMFWIGEKLEVFKAALSDWKIGFDCYNYIKISDASLFIQCYKDCINIYSSDNQTIAAVNEANEYILNNYEDDEFDEKIEEFAHKLEKRLIAYFNNCLIDNDDADELIGYLVNSELLDNYYIWIGEESEINNNTYVIYEKIIKAYR